MLKASNPTEKPTELRAACGCRFTPRSLVPEADEGTLELTHICVPHSQQRAKLLEEEESNENRLESVADAGYCHGCGFFDHGDAPCDLPPKRLSERAVMCVECEQVLDGGRCTNELCSGYSPRDDDQSCERVSGVCPKCGFDFSPPCERVTMGCCPKCCEHLGFKCAYHGCDWPAGEKVCPQIMKASPASPPWCW